MILLALFRFWMIWDIGLSLSGWIIISALFWDMSLAPENEIEISARVRAGASLMPSPTMMNFLLVFLRLVRKFILSIGDWLWW